MASVVIAYFVNKNFALDLSVIIVNFNVKYFLEHCLLSLRTASGNLKVEVWVVDNSSTEGSKSFFQNKFPEVNFVFREDNVGFSRANNSVLSQCTGDYILFLNPDTIVAEQVLSECIDFFATHPECGALGVRMIDGSGHFLPESKRGFPSFSASFYKQSGIEKRFPANKKIGAYYAKHLAETDTGTVDVLSGAFLMMSRAAVAATNGFDESFFMYGEDIDLSYRIKKAGFENYYLGKTTIIHFKGESSDRASPSFRKNFYGAMQIFSKKHFAMPKAMMLQSVIWLSKHFSGTAKKTLPQNLNVDKNWKELQTLIIGEELLMNKFHLIEHHQSVQQKILALPPGNPDNFFKLKGLIQDAVIVNTVQNLVLSNTGLSYDAMIKLMSAFSGRLSFFIHSKGAASVVGSADKARQGNVIIL